MFDHGGSSEGKGGGSSPSSGPNRLPRTSEPRGASFIGQVEGPETWQRGNPLPASSRDGGDARLYADQPGGVVAGLLDDLTGLDDDALVLRARELAGVISTAEASLALVAAEIERRKLPSQWECQTIERFAGWQLEMAPTRARQLADVGRAMATMPTLAEAVSDGTLSFDKAVVVARSADEASEEALVDLATRSTVAQAQRLGAAWRRQRATDPHLGAGPADGCADTEGPLAVPPTVLVVRDADGVELRARFDHVDGAMVLASLEAATSQVRTERASAAPADPARERPAGLASAEAHEDSREQLMLDEWRGLGLLRLAEASLDEVPRPFQRNGFDTQVVLHIGVDTLLDPADGSLTATHSGPADRSTFGESGTPAEPDRDADPGPIDGAPSTAPVLEVDDVLDRLAVGGPNGGGVLEPSGAYLRRDTARFLACDAGLLTVLEDDAGDPLHVGPAHRTISRSIRRAAVARDRTCAWPGCTATRVYIHHRHHRAKGGHDDVENACPLCWAHHKAVHEFDIRVEHAGGDGTPGRPRFRFFRPDGTELTSAPADRLDGLPAPPPAGEAEQVLFDRHVASGADPAQPGRWCRWEGDPLRLGDAVAALYARRDGALRRTRPT
jgi:hypothetical protein